MALIAIATVAALALIAGSALGWPPASSAFANESATRLMLGVDADTAVELGPEMPISEKFGVAAITGRIAAPASLMAHAPKKAAPLPKKSLRTAVKVSASRAAAPVKSSGKASGAWKRAKCSTYGIGDGLIGNGMAGGGKLRADSMVVAHKTLPFGTKIRFKYKGRTCIAEVRDRGPYIKGRIFDLGPGTAKALKFSGVGMVSYQIIGR